ncbi:uncharacterized protein LOC109536227 [Dendroctonus ponderosae]|uniref:uncharacterized protein LOC109536227 n=1 Tax=Dendroctonus ponderosae TaxID=77166 RepID=UPI002035B862|nr:uncharacterized protein LOC109536227 [Dendroctonus ponderosae]
MPPDLGSGGGPKLPDTQPDVTAGPSTIQGNGLATTLANVPETQNDSTIAPGLPEGAPTQPAEELPGPFPTHPEVVPESGSATTTLAPGYPDVVPGAPFTSQPQPPAAPEQTQPSFPPYTSPEATQAPAHETTPPAEPSSTTLQSEVGPEATTPALAPADPDQAQTAEGNEPVPAEHPAGPEGGDLASESPVPEAPAEPAPGSTLPPASAFTASTPTTLAEHPQGTTTEEAAAATTANPEVNTIPGAGKQSPDVSEEELKHPPHIHAIDVQCGKEMMTINIEFNREFNGVIYSKGFHSSPECRYVQENSGNTKYTFTVSLEKCGTEFVNAFDTQNQSYLENVLVLQNEPGIQEVWDTVRSVRCLWEGNIKDTLSVAFSIGMLSQEIITFSGDTAMAKLDVLLGRGHLGAPANGLVKIGEEMTLVVSVSGDPGFDVQVKDCKAVDTAGANSIALTDEDGCILKPKLFGAFQKTRETGDSGASIMAYAYFNAFKFPDEMDLMIECNIELCKSDCDICSKDDQQVIPARRRRRNVSNNDTVVGDWVTMGKLVRVILPEDLNGHTALEITRKDHICMSMQGFVFSTAVLVSLLVLTSFVSVCLWLKKKEKMYLKY